MTRAMKLTWLCLWMAVPVFACEAGAKKVSRDADAARLVEHAKSPPPAALEREIGKKNVAALCTDKSGRRYRQGDDGFDACLANYYQESQLEARQPTRPRSDQDPSHLQGRSVGVELFTSDTAE